MADAHKWACRGGKIVGPVPSFIPRNFMPHIEKQQKSARWRRSPVSDRYNHHRAARGNDRKHARAPFSAVRASWKLKVDGFSSSRGALHDPHHEKTTKPKTSRRPLGGGRWRPAPRCGFHHFRECDTHAPLTCLPKFSF